MLGRPGVTRSLLLLATFVLGIAAGRAPVTAQPAGPEAALRAAADDMEANGYVARFSWADAGPHGEVRYRSQLAYGLYVESDAGAALEYAFLDPVLYSRQRPSAEAAWSGWERRSWHPDLPLEGLVQYHPRLLVELLRRARDLRTVDAGDGFLEIEGRVSYLEAIAGAYEDEVPGALQPTLGAALLPLTVRLDAAGAVAQVVVRVTPPPESEAPPNVLTFDLLPEPAALQAPEGAEEAAPSLFLRPGPSEAAQPLPLTLRGTGREVRTPPFVSATGVFAAQVDPPLTGVQYRLWRVKRGALLLGPLGTSVGIGGLALPALPLPPGEYVLELTLPEAVDWTVTIVGAENQ